MDQLNVNGAVREACNWCPPDPLIDSLILHSDDYKVNEQLNDLLQIHPLKS